MSVRLLLYLLIAAAYVERATGDSRIDGSVIPGTSVAQFRLGESLPALIVKHGDPSDQDMSLGTAVAEWRFKQRGGDTTPRIPENVVILFHRGADRIEYMADEVMTNDPQLRTPKGISTGAPAEKIRRAYPDVTLFVVDKTNSVRLLDSVPAGIAFRIDAKDQCVGIIVHRRGVQSRILYQPGVSNK